ncbi:MAG: methyltransferase domain-containing protein [Gluconacetobacter diazotrophicus]|nr:methyltransferase domain-containing protein [Gluconacetobacter diazotrophicus]
MDEEMFDRTVVRLRRDRAAGTVVRVREILDEVADRLVDRLDDTTRRFERALDLGGRGAVAPKLRGRGIEVVSADLSARMAARAGGRAVAADEEWLPFAAASFDLVVANLSLHWVNDLPGALVQLRAALKPDGLLLASVPVLPTLAPLRTALAEAEAVLSGGVAPRVSPFPTLQDCAALLQRAGFALPVADGETVALRYADPADIVRDLRAAGEASALRLRERRGAPAMLVPAALAGLDADPSDGRVPMTLHLAMLTGWAPAPTQPKPLPRGSATMRLEDALRELPDGTGDGEPRDGE